MNAEEKIREVSIHTLSWYIADWINKKKCKKCKLLAFDTTFSIVTKTGGLDKWTKNYQK